MSEQYQKRDIREFFGLVKSKRHTVLFSKAGGGKTALLEAELSTLLGNDIYKPIFIRFDNKTETPDQTVLRKIEEQAKQMRLDKLAAKRHRKMGSGKSLWERLKAYPFENDLAIEPVLIFDQFEDFFRHNTNGRQKFIEFLADLVLERVPKEVKKRVVAIDPEKRTKEQLELLEPLNWKVIFVLPDDKLWVLDILKPSIPGILNNRYWLGEDPNFILPAFGFAQQGKPKEKKEPDPKPKDTNVKPPKTGGGLGGKLFFLLSIALVATSAVLFYMAHKKNEQAKQKLSLVIPTKPKTEKPNKPNKPIPIPEPKDSTKVNPNPTDPNIGGNDPINPDPTDPDPRPDNPVDPDPNPINQPDPLDSTEFFGGGEPDNPILDGEIDFSLMGGDWYLPQGQSLIANQILTFHRTPQGGEEIVNIKGEEILWVKEGEEGIETLGLIGIVDVDLIRIAIVVGGDMEVELFFRVIELTPNNMVWELLN